MSSWPNTRDDARRLGYECVMWNDLTGIPIVLRSPHTNEEITKKQWEEDEDGADSILI